MPLESRGQLGIGDFTLISAATGSAIFGRHRCNHMRVYIEGPHGIVLNCSDDKNAPVLAPLDRSERALAFQALTGALALLAGVTPLSSSAATEASMDESISATPQYCDHHTSGVVVHLSKRMGAEDV
jgi:hypothetical protein